MKRLITLLLALAMIFSLAACGAKTVEIGKTVKKGIAEFTIKDIHVANTNYLEGNIASDDFLYPIDKNDLAIGDQYIKAADETTAPVVISLIVENVGKSDLSIYPFDFVVNYDDGNKYYSKKCYAKTESSGWTGFEKVTLEKVTSGAVEIRIAIWVPTQVVEDSKPRRAVSGRSDSPGAVRRFCTIWDCGIGMGCADRYRGYGEGAEFAPGDCVNLANGPSPMVEAGRFLLAH